MPSPWHWSRTDILGAPSEIAQKRIVRRWNPPCRTSGVPPSRHNRCRFCRHIRPARRCCAYACEHPLVGQIGFGENPFMRVAFKTPAPVFAKAFLIQSRYRFDQCDCRSKGVPVSEPENILRETALPGGSFTAVARGRLWPYQRPHRRSQRGPDDAARSRKLSHPEDFLLCDLEGNLIGKEGKLPGEPPIHLEVFKARPDVNSVAHFHTHNATSFRCLSTT